MGKERNAVLCCSFCGKSQQEVKKLIAGPTVYICDSSGSAIRSARRNSLAKSGRRRSPSMRRCSSAGCSTVGRRRPTSSGEPPRRRTGTREEVGAQGSGPGA